MPFNWPPDRHLDDFTHHEDFSGELREHYRRKPDPIEIEPTPETKPEKQPRFTVQGVIFFVLVVSGLLVLGQFILPLFPEEYIEVLIYAYLYFAMGFDPTKWFSKLFGPKKK